MGKYARELGLSNANVNEVLGEQIGYENNNFVSLSFSQKMLYADGIFVSYRLDPDQFKRLVRGGRLKSGINPQHTLSIQAAHDLFGLDLEVKEEKPVVRIGETGDSVATMQTDAPRYLLKTSRSHYSDQEIRQAKIKFRRFEYLCPIMDLPDEVLEFFLEKYLFKRKAKSLAYCH